MRVNWNRYYLRTYLHNFISCFVAFNAALLHLPCQRNGFLISIATCFYSWIACRRAEKICGTNKYCINCLFYHTFLHCSCMQ